MWELRNSVAGSNEGCEAAISPVLYDYIEEAVKLMKSMEDNEINQWWARLELQRLERGIQVIAMLETDQDVSCLNIVSIIIH